MYHKKSPFITRDIGELSKMIESNRLCFKSGLDRNIINLILDILQIDPVKRPSALEILHNPNFSKLLKKFELEHLKEESDKNM